jgi:hypothetical protein
MEKSAMSRPFDLRSSAVPFSTAFGNGPAVRSCENTMLLAVVWPYRLARLPDLSYSGYMKTLTVRLPDSLVAEIEHESRTRNVSKSDVVRERLCHPHRRGGKRGTMRELVGDLIGSVEGLPSDLAGNKKKYLSVLIRAKKLHSR